MKKAVKESLAGMLERDGRLIASGVLKAATDKRSVLHNEFEWDDEKASHQYRMWQARSLIKQYSVTIKESEKKLIHVPPHISAKQREGEYRPVASVVKVQSEFERALSEARKMLRAAKANVELLERQADSKDEESNAAIIAIAMRGLDMTNAALDRLH